MKMNCLILLAATGLSACSTKSLEANSGPEWTAQNPAVSEEVKAAPVIAVPLPGASATAVASPEVIAPATDAWSTQASAESALDMKTLDTGYDASAFQSNSVAGLSSSATMLPEATLQTGPVDDSSLSRAVSTGDGVLVTDVAVGIPTRRFGNDVDQDGVPDQRDRCMDSTLGVEVDPRGCEVDSDSDSVVDSRDKCPDTEIGVAVGKIGCPAYLDLDDDGVLNDADECADTEPGLPVNAQGCTQAVETLLLADVQFEYKSTQLTQSAKNSLEALVKRFKSREGMIAEVAGHTDSIASASYNQQLSARRANAVRDYLVSRGVESKQLRAKGYGESQPIASNETKQGQARNRRVELRIYRR